MQEHQLYLDEKQKIDTLLENNFCIVGIIENLSGTFVAFKQAEETGNAPQATVQLLIPETRKYVTNLLFTSRLDQSVS
ncbi:hypothetical protein [Sporolactobacillus terrae]|uniref:Uncharacterized protein n=1 Tax=Sporolactobacillus terrae TaxID=269673 RepID=A0A410D6H7_9BACL|nr:hypothetical protein [Sporolactobacillus terrae]QAA21710.1 hypothetical protein C0674_03210 [Sporolactobacillus terrae]QAA24682.1 hypothetical protein C0679_03190 [Sporolactobacillus terrae]UAK16517.1 hypothetical protein K7399_00590 [Sporolactobacillus terrae]BBN97977.1 hypothetical protein St703_06820 [Sporolactobacillus terrae]